MNRTDGTMAGVPMTLVGFAEKRIADHAYVVGFRQPGDECGPERLELDANSGAPLDCVRSGMLPASRPKVDLAGFSEVQNEQIHELATTLGQDGLTTSERQQIQRAVDQIAATIPAGAKPYGAGLSGARRLYVGAAMLGVSLLVSVLMYRGGTRDFRTGI